MQWSIWNCQVATQKIHEIFFFSLSLQQISDYMFLSYTLSDKQQFFYKRKMNELMGTVQMQYRRLPASCVKLGRSWMVNIWITLIIQTKGFWNVMIVHVWWQKVPVILHCYQGAITPWIHLWNKSQAPYTWNILFYRTLQPAGSSTWDSGKYQ